MIFFENINPKSLILLKYITISIYYKNKSFYRTEPTIKNGSIMVLVDSSPQHGKNTTFLFSFPLGGIYG